MSAELIVWLPDATGVERCYLTMALREENGVDYTILYAILSPEDPGTDPNAYVAYGYYDDPETGTRKYYRFPRHIERRLVREYTSTKQLTDRLRWTGPVLAVA